LIDVAAWLEEEIDPDSAFSGAGKNLGYAFGGGERLFEGTGNFINRYFWGNAWASSLAPMRG
jgi:hypothetical protein